MDAIVKLLPFLIIGGIVLLVVGIFAASFYFEKKRREGMRLAAEELGLPFFPQGDPQLISELSGFHLFSQGRGKRITNMIHGDTEDVDLGIFDYQYTTGSGKHQRTAQQTVICFRSSQLALPTFVLRPEGFFDKIGAVFGMQDIDFGSHPDFSKTYVLRGHDEPRIREVFSSEALSHLESQRGICVEGNGSRLICYRSAKRIPPAAVRTFLEEGFGVFRHFCS